MRAKAVKAIDGCPVLFFVRQNDWSDWLGKNFGSPSGLWMRLAKKGSGLQSVTYGEAVEIALQYGWIDGQKRPENERTWLQKFVPRSDKSIWSRINREKALALIQRGEMKPAGFAAIERAKKNGRWDAAYDSPSRAAVPADLRKALNANSKAKAFFETLDRGNRYAVLFRIQTVKKTETRARKIREFVAMLERKETIHPARKTTKNRGSAKG